MTAFFIALSFVGGSMNIVGCLYSVAIREYEFAAVNGIVALFNFLILGVLLQISKEKDQGGKK